MFYKLIVVASVLALAASECQPLYWETNPTYKINATELEYVATLDAVLKPVSDRKNNYHIDNIHGNVTYIKSSSNTSTSGNITYVNGSILNIAYTFTASHSKYKGSATAHLNGIVINYTKTPMIIDGNASFKIDLTLLTIPEIVPGDYNPKPSDSQKAEFNKLVSDELTTQMRSTYNAELLKQLQTGANKTSLPYSFDSQPYKYTYASGINESLTVQIDTRLTNYTVFEQRGYLLGYNGTVNGRSTVCSNYTPTDFTKNASFFPAGFMKSLYNEFLTNFSVWKNFTVDQTNAKSSYFGFRVIDLDGITPSYINNHPNLASRIYASCVIDASLPAEIQLDPSSNEVRTTAGWTCKMYQVGSSDIILSFYTLNEYRLQVRQNDTKLQVQISGATPKSSKWNSETMYPIVNEKLADIYLTEIVAAFNGQYTLGTGFMQPRRITPKVVFWNETIQVYDTVTEVEE